MMRNGGAAVSHVGTPTPRNTNAMPVESISVFALTWIGGTGMGVGGACPSITVEKIATSTASRITPQSLHTQTPIPQGFAVNLQVHMRFGSCFAILLFPFMLGAQSVVI